MLQGDLGHVLTPEQIELLHIEWLNTCKNKVEMIMRLRALAEISQIMDTDSLLSLSEYLSKGGDWNVLVYRG